MQEIAIVSGLSDEEVVSCLARCVREDRQVTARLLLHLAEVDARGLFRDQGYPSMFEYAVRKLHMSESEAGLRISVAKVVRAFPIAFELLARGELHLTALRLLAPVLTQDNIGLLQEARFKSKKQVLELLARHTPRPDVPDSIRRLPEPRRAPTNAPRSAAPAPSFDFEPTASVSPTPPQCGGLSRPPLSASSVPLGPHVELEATKPQTRQTPGLDQSVPSVAAVHASPNLEPEAASPPTPRPSAFGRSTPSAAAILLSRCVEPIASATPKSRQIAGFVRPTPSAAIVPLSPGRYKLTFTMSQKVRDKLEEAQDLLRHQLPDGDLERVFERALDLLIEQRKKQKFGQTPRPRNQPPESDTTESRYIPRELRRQVWDRCEGRCCFVAPDGQRCSARGALEFHHIEPFARGGPTTADNLSLMCKAHNTLLAERDYGRDLIHHRISTARSARNPRSIQPRDPQHPLRTRHLRQPDDATDLPVTDELAATQHFLPLPSIHHDPTHHPSPGA